MPSKTPKKPASQSRRGRPAGSLAEQIDRLQPGDSVSQSKRIPLDDGPHDTAEAIKQATSAMRGVLGAYVSRIMAEGDGLDMREYRTESGNFVTDDKTAIIVSVVLTRTS